MSLNPFSILSGAPGSGISIPLTGGGGLIGSSTAESKSIQDIFFDSPFNVGSGELSSSASANRADDTGISTQWLVPVAMFGAAALAAAVLLK